MQKKPVKNVSFLQAFSEMRKTYVFASPFFVRSECIHTKNIATAFAVAIFYIKY